MNQEKPNPLAALTIFFLGLILLGIIIGVIIVKMGRTLPMNCDYDSCSQASVNWTYNGSACFDRNNSDCSNFLELWKLCQENKSRMGVC